MTEQREILYYMQDCTLARRQKLTEANIMDTIGMVVRCTMQSGEVYEGYSDVIGDAAMRAANWDGKNMYLWKWAHWDEETQKLTGDKITRYDMYSFLVPVEEIARIEAILYSGPRWGGRLSNHFFLNI